MSTFNPADLYVISVISNPIRYRSRVRLFQQFMDDMDRAGVQHWIVEAVYGEREPSVLDREMHPRHIKVRCDDEVWLKENLINIAAQRLPDEAKYIMWCDGDIRFGRDDWAVETIEQLQHHPVVQPFSHAIDYGPFGEVLEMHKGFAYCYVQGAALGPKNKLGNWRYGGPYWHPGYAWAFRRDVWDALGGMIDRGIAGSGDYHMASALIGKGDMSYPQAVHPNYKHMIKMWQDRAVQAMHKDIGYVFGSIHHNFHGKKADRQYVSRWDILTGTNYDPYSDVGYDMKGVLQLTGSLHDDRARRLRDGLRAYFRSRNEDPS